MADVLRGVSHVRFGWDIAPNRPAQPSPTQPLKDYYSPSHCILTYRPSGVREAMRCH